MNNVCMQRRQWLKRMFSLAAAPTSVPVVAIMNSTADSAHPGDNVAKLQKSKSEWRKLLTREAYAVLFEERTEAAFTSPLDREKRPGSYVCAACYLPLFSSKAKFDSGTGWPSFFRPLPKSVVTRADRSLLVERTEVLCRRCGGHLGHVFEDGPKPTGLRYCMNGLALRFRPA